MAIIFHRVRDYNTFKKLASDLMKKQKALVLGWFVGAEDDGRSWCPDCCDAKPIIDEYLSELKMPKDLHVLYTEIDKENYYSNSCPYRADNRIRLKSIPTLLCMNEQQRLSEHECTDLDLLQLLFDDAFEKALRQTVPQIRKNNYLRSANSKRVTIITSSTKSINM